MTTTIQLRRDTAANWTAHNPILALGEEGYETDTGKRKVGDGVAHWTALVYDHEGLVAGVSSVAGRAGAVVLAVADVAGAAPNASPALTGNPTVNGIPTARRPQLVASLTGAMTMQHQSAQLVVQATVVVPPNGELVLEPRVAGYTEGAEYSGMTFFFLLGVPVGGGNNCGGILGEEVNQAGTGGPNPALHDVVGTACYPVSNTRGMFGAMVALGNINNDWGFSSLSRKIIYTGLTPGQTLTAQILAGEDSGADVANWPTTTDVWGATALTPTYDTSPDYPNVGSGGCRDLWIVNMTQQTLMRYTIGRTTQARYEGIQPRLLYKNSLPMPNSTLYSAIVIDGNGKLATAGGTGSTITLVDTAHDSAGVNNHRGTVLVTTAAQASTIDDLKAAPDNTGFWVAIHNTSLIKINPTTGATITTIAGLAGTGKLNFCLSPDGTKAYVFSSVIGLFNIDLTTGTITAGPTVAVLANVAAMACSPDGLSVLLSSSAYQTWVLAKYPTAGANLAISGSAPVTYAARIGSQLANLQAYSIAFSADSKQWFITGLKGVWIYGWTSNMAVFDGTTAEVASDGVGYISVTDFDGIYIAWSGGTTPSAFIFAFPGVKCVIDPTTTNYGMGYAEVLAS